MSKKTILSVLVIMFLGLCQGVSAQETSDSVLISTIKKNMQEHYKNGDTKAIITATKLMKALERQSDSLMAINKDLQLSERHTKAIANENAANVRMIKRVGTATLALVAFLFVAIYANSRRVQLRKLREAYDKLEETTVAKERIESELRIAREIQMGMMPHYFPDNKNLDIYATITPAKEVSGDLYDFVSVEDKLYFCVGDVSGKGVPAALFMSMTARLFRALCKYKLSPKEIATSMNNELTQDNENCMFVTMFIGRLNLTTGVLDFCNAGHNPPILDGQFIEMEANAPLGLWENVVFEGQTLGDITGKQLFVYSDGLNEAENSEHDQYSEERLKRIVGKHLNDSSRQLIDLLEHDVEAHVAGATPHDDLTMLCIRKK